jgi:hypothetical protein
VGRPKVLFLFNGKRYWWSGWYGCQLASREWATLPAGTTRDFDFYDGKPPVRMTVFSTRRDGLGVITKWAVSSACCHDEHQRRILELKERLAGLV